MTISQRNRLVLLALVCLAAAHAFTRADEPALPAAFQQPIPQGTPDLQAVQTVVLELAARVLPCTVGVEVGMAMGSGVIVSEDGYVLTAAHVAGRPGRDVRISLPDGTRLAGKTLGIHTIADGALIKISTRRSLPFAPLVPSDEAPAVGDWCLATGHPNGFQRERSAPVRLGRIIEKYPSVIRTDCPITEGDSGGPLFDMRGRVIGIHSRITEDVTDNFHGPAEAFQETWDELRAAKIVPVRPPSQFLDLLDVDRDGKVSRSELPEGFQRRVFDRLVKQFNLDPEESHSIEELAEEVFQWRPTAFLTFGPMAPGEGEVSQTLARGLFVRGRSIRNLFANANESAAQSVVRVKSDGGWVGLGAIVSPDGYVLTKASELRDAVICRLADGREVPAQLIAVDDQNDLAILHTDTADLTPVDWAPSDLTAGSWLITPSTSSRAASVGVVSVAARRVARGQAVLGVEIDIESGAARVQQAVPRGGAEEAGIRSGDFITHIEDQPVGNLDELKAALRAFRPGDVIQATVEREDETLVFEITLGSPEDVFFRTGIERMNGPLSRRRDDFPQAVQHDSILHPTQCGGPAIDLSGKAVGINIARADRVTTYLIPYAAFAEFIARHTSPKADTQAEDE